MFQSYQDNVRVIVKGCVQWNRLYSWEDLHFEWGSNLEPLGRFASLAYWATWAARLEEKTQLITKHYYPKVLKDWDT